MFIHINISNSTISNISSTNINDSENIHNIITLSFVITSAIGILMCHVYHVYKQRDKVLPM